jgi:hypothetical protein
MLHSKRFSVSPFIFILVALTLSVALSCCDSPTAPGPTADNGLGGSGAIDPGASGSFLLGEVSDTSIGPGTLEIWAMNVAFDDTAGLVTFDAQILNRTQRTITPPIHFVITSITPHDVTVADFDGVSPDGFPFYDFSAKLGSDNVLTPGERTERITMKFHTATARSFAIGFRIDIGPPDGTGTIGGVVFLDGNENGVRDRECRCEYGIPGITVALERTLENGDRVMLLTRTDANGEYRFAGNKEGVHKVFVHAPENLWRITSANPLLVTLIKGADGKVQDFLGANFGLWPLTPPPNPVVRLFGPVIVGPPTPFGTELDSTFANPPSPLTVSFEYYLEVNVPVREMCFGFNVVDSAEAWINDEMVFMYRRENLGDTIWAPYRFERHVVELPDSVVITGENTIRLITDGDECAALEWKVCRDQVALMELRHR